MSLSQKLEFLKKGLEENKQKDLAKQKAAESWERHEQNKAEWNTREWLRNALPVFEKKVIEELKDASWTGLFKDKKVVYLHLEDYGGFKYREYSDCAPIREPYSSQTFDMLVSEAQKKHPEWLVRIVAEKKYEPYLGKQISRRIEVTQKRS